LNRAPPFIYDVIQKPRARSNSEHVYTLHTVFKYKRVETVALVGSSATIQNVPPFYLNEEYKGKEDSKEGELQMTRSRNEWFTFLLQATRLELIFFPSFTQLSAPSTTPKCVFYFSTSSCAQEMTKRPRPLFFPQVYLPV
jgi:hypothetical protein